MTPKEVVLPPVDIEPEELARRLVSTPPTPPTPPLKAIAGAPDRPLIIGEIEIQCYVLEDETRVLTQRGVARAVGGSRGGAYGPGDAGAEIPKFMRQNWLQPFIHKGLPLAPILFSMPTGGTAFGYLATLLPEICDAILEACKQGATTPRQQPMVDRALALTRGFAKLGIIALVDEATGYQDVRKVRLAELLEKFLDEKRQPWERTFPYEFYDELFRLHGWKVRKD